MGSLAVLATADTLQSTSENKPESLGKGSQSNGKSKALSTTTYGYLKNVRSDHDNLRAALNVEVVYNLGLAWTA